MPNLPQAIIYETLREQGRQGWPEMVPAYAEFIDERGRHVFCPFKEMTVARCEQSVEFHRRKALQAIDRYLKTATQKSARTAGFHIIRARLWRCQYFTLSGQEETTEDDMPFPHHSYRPLTSDL